MSALQNAIAEHNILLEERALMALILKLSREAVGLRLSITLDTTHLAVVTLPRQMGEDIFQDIGEWAESRMVSIDEILSNS